MRRGLGVPTLLVAVMLVAAACSSGGSDGGGGGGGDEQPGAGISVGFVYDGATDDGGWNTSHEAGRQYLLEQLPGVETVNIEGIAPGEQARATFEDLATQGFDLVVGTTFYQADALAVAKDFPDTKFVTWGGWKTADNVGQYSLATEDGRYLDGIVAGSLTETGTIGYTGGFAIEEVVRGINAFGLGVQSVNPSATIVPVYTNSWWDPPKEREAAESLVDSGADILVHELNSPATASVASRRGVWLIGYGWNQEATAPEHWLSSFVFNWGPYYVDQVEAIADGTWTPEVYYGGIADGVVTMSPFGEIVPQEVVGRVEEVEQQIASGEFDVFAGPIADNQGQVRVADGETISVAERPACCDWYVENVEGSVPQG